MIILETTHIPFNYYVYHNVIYVVWGSSIMSVS
jgi:hypothetical protein